MTPSRSLWTLSLALAASQLGPGPLAAQGFPAASPKASLTQQLGLNEITITYSRPRVRDRVIWGELVPFGTVWRTGADYPTFFETRAELEVEGQRLPAGKYALYTIPTPERWTVVFSRNIDLWGAFGYSPEHDELCVEVQPRPAPFAESFTIEIAEVTRNRAELVLRWERLEVPIRLAVDDLARVRSLVEAAEEDDWGACWKGAEYLLEIGRDLSLARRWIDRSVAIEGNWMNLWTSAQIHAAAGGLEKAAEVGRAALDLCIEQQPYCPYTEVYRRDIEGWTDPEAPLALKMINAALDHEVELVRGKEVRIAGPDRKEPRCVLVATVFNGRDRSVYPGYRLVLEVLGEPSKEVAETKVLVSVGTVEIAPFSAGSRELLLVQDVNASAGADWVASEIYTLGPGCELQRVPLGETHACGIELPPLEIEDMHSPRRVGFYRLREGKLGFSTPLWCPGDAPNFPSGGWAEGTFRIEPDSEGRLVVRVADCSGSKECADGPGG